MATRTRKKTSTKQAIWNKFSHNKFIVPLLFALVAGTVGVLLVIRSFANTGSVGPTQLSAAPISDTAIRLSWYPGSQVGDGFRIYRNDVLVGIKPVLISMGGYITYDDAGLSPSTSYSYRVAINTTGGEFSTSVVQTTTFTTPDPASLGSINGQVLGVNKTPLSGASVFIYYSYNSHRVTADANGNFSFSSVPAGNYSVQYSMTGYKTTSAKVNVKGGITTTSSITLRPVR